MIVTKLGARRPADKSWQPAISREELISGVHDNLRNLGLEVLDVVNYRAMGAIHGPAEGSGVSNRSLKWREASAHQFSL